MRITSQHGNRFALVDEKFNKHIIFHSRSFTGNIAYTGIAQWIAKGHTTKLYDVISQSIAKSAKSAAAFGPLSYELVNDIVATLSQPSLQIKAGQASFELHIMGYHQGIPWPFIGVISTYRTDPPWPKIEGEAQWEYKLPGIYVYFKVAEDPSVFFGGMGHLVTDAERNALLHAVSKGADAFNVSRMCSTLIEKVSTRTASVGPRSVSIVFPRKGMIDTNLWDKTESGIVGFWPRMIFPNGTIMGPSEFPVQIAAMTSGHLPRESLFAKSIVASAYKRSIKRKIFGLKKGLVVPGLMGLVMLGLFGCVPEGYENFGLSVEKDQEP